ncbi:S9 family peptidase [Sediminibacterium sp.]|uniref:S9 family peptidase n=1 Tax=Sediminibacterium sp. TaxID=1917865 RepID=UPI002736FB4F|nr:S9 family peptidase [Sediminibacterium sp.]MDP3567344.1 DPP IV N-terminal domain-containing protein [Sediminibacterium sp.]
MKKLTLLITLFLGIYSTVLFSQNQLLTIQDAIWKGRTSLAPKRLQAISFIPDSKKIAYIEKNELIIISAETGKTVSTISTLALNKNLSKTAIDTITAFEGLRWISENQFYFTNKKGEWLYSIDKGAATKSERKQSDFTLENLENFKEGEIFAYVNSNNLFVSDNGKVTQVTTDGSYEIVNAKTVHQSEFGINKGIFWSPNGNALAYYRMNQTDVDDYPIIDWSTYPAINKNIKYPMAGKKSHYVTVFVYNLKSNTSTLIKTEGPKEQYLTNIAWSPDEKKIYIAVLNREQNHYKLNEYDAKTGDFVKTLFEEKDEKYAEPLNPMLFVKNNPSQFIWQSRRDGYNHFYLYNINGTLIKQLTKGNWEAKDDMGFDEKGENLFFQAAEQSPINQDFYSVNLKSGKIKRLTKDNGYHSVVLSKKGDFFIDSYSSCYTPREYRIVDASTGKSNTIFKADNPIKDYQLGKWNMFTIKNVEGIDLHCRMFKPVNFDSTKKYPVLVYLYNGPHSQMVTNTWMAGGELWYQYMAQKGFIVFTLDGRGTNYRGKAFEQAIHRQVGTKEMEDQISGVNYLKSLPYVDATRLGVHGWSYGGFMTTSLMSRYPGVFKVGAAGGPVIDWSYYEIMYGERYNDSPQENKEGYDKNNLLNHVQNLKGKLLMIHGAQDNVVVWQHSIMYQKKAVEKGVQLDYYVYPGHEHNVLGKDRAHLMEKITNYFIDNL